MKSFQDIQTVLGELPNYPKIYLLGSTGAGKTSIVRAILGTASEVFPSILQTRTTVAPTEYIVSKNRSFKSTFIFKKKEDVENSLSEILVASIEKALSFRDKNDDVDNINNLIPYLEETSDERFRLKYLLSEDLLREFADYIINIILPEIQYNIISEEVFNLTSIQKEIYHVQDQMLDAIIKKAKEICPDYELFSDYPYVINNFLDKKEFILRNKALLKSDLNSVSPLIEYARIEGDLSADWLPDNLEFVLIDGEGIGHNLKEVKSSLSTRHLDFFNFSDSIFLVEKSDDPFISGGKNAIETIFLNGYSKKFKLIFSKTDKLDVKDYKTALNRRIGNVENALKDSNIEFDLNKDQKYYLSNLDKTTNDSTQKELIKLFKNIKNDFNKNEDNPIDLEYDFEELFLNLNTTYFLDSWDSKLKYEHWTIVKALTRRMFLKEGEYRYLKPILDLHTLIMQEVNNFLRKDNQLNSDVSFAQNKIKQNFSYMLLKYIRNEFMLNYLEDWNNAYVKSGHGSSITRSIAILNIFNNFIPKASESEKFNEFKEEIKKYLIEAGAKEISATTKVYIKEIEFKKIYGVRNLKWELDSNTNILIGKNGSGKSSILKLIDAKFNNDINILEEFKNPNITLTVVKEYENGDIKPIEFDNNAHSQNIDITLVDTFDIKPNSIIECKENCDKKQSLLEIELLKLLPRFDAYQIKLNKIFEERNDSTQKEIQRIIDEIGKGNTSEAEKIQDLTNNKNHIFKDVYKPLNDFTQIIDSMFKDTDKKINLDSIEKSFSISSASKELEPLDLSSGEKQILIIFLTILLKENKPYILMMDEPENSLHSEWQIHFIENIRKLNKNVQIIIATHNPLLMLDRESNEIGKISIDSDVVDIQGEGTKYLDVSATLLNYPKISSLVGKDMQDNISELFKLKNQDNLLESEKNQIDELEIKLGKTVASNFIYDRHYLHFLKFIQNNKNIDFDKLTEISEDDMDELLGEFKDLFND